MIWDAYPLDGCASIEQELCAEGETVYQYHDPESSHCHVDYECSEGLWLCWLRLI